jgi:hypothetical protein
MPSVPTKSPTKRANDIFRKKGLFPFNFRRRRIKQLVQKLTERRMPLDKNTFMLAKMVWSKVIFNEAIGAFRPCSRNSQILFQDKKSKGFIKKHKRISPLDIKVT